MKTLRLLLLFVVVATLPLDAQTVCRKAIFTNCAKPRFNPAAEGGQDEYAGLFTLGTLFGASVGHNPSTYKIENGVVKYQDRAADVQFTVLALPSINVVGAPGQSLAAIVPMGKTPSGDFGAGLGLSWGFNVKGSWEIGLAAAGVMGRITELTAAQQTSLDNRTALPAGASTDLEERPVVFFSFGIYAAPLKKEK